MENKKNIIYHVMNIEITEVKNLLTSSIGPEGYETFPTFITYVRDWGDGKQRDQAEDFLIFLRKFVIKSDYVAVDRTVYRELCPISEEKMKKLESYQFKFLPNHGKGRYNRKDSDSGDRS